MGTLLITNGNNNLFTVIFDPDENGDAVSFIGKTINIMIKNNINDDDEDAVYNHDYVIATESTDNHNYTTVQMLIAAADTTWIKQQNYVLGMALIGDDGVPAEFFNQIYEGNYAVKRMPDA